MKMKFLINFLEINYFFLQPRYAFASQKLLKMINLNVLDTFYQSNEFIIPLKCSASSVCISNFLTSYIFKSKMTSLLLISILQSRFQL